MGENQNNQTVSAEVKDEKKTRNTTPKKEKKALDKTYQVLVMNNTSGKLGWTSPKTSTPWLFEKYGDEDYIELHELMTMKSAHPAYFKENWIVVKDTDAFEHLKLENFYKGIYDPEELDALFEKPVDEINGEIDKASGNIRSLIIGRARDKFESGELTDVRVIKLIESKLNTKIDVNNNLG
jgi:hypothetical protein